MCLIHDIINRKKLDFEMAKKIPVQAVLSFWSSKGIAIPLSSHAKSFLFLNQANAYFSKRRDFSQTYKPFMKSLKIPFTAKQLQLSPSLKKKINSNDPIAT